MKTLAIVAAALTISLSVAETASAQTSVTTTSSTRTDALGDRQTTTSSTRTDAFGDRQTTTSSTSNNGRVRCGSVTQSISDGRGDSVTRTRHGCRPDF